MTRVGDLAAQAADQLMTEHVKAIDADGEEELGDEEVMIRELKKNLFSKIQFRWRSEDEKILEQIRAGVDELFAEMYEESFYIIDEFYGQMRIPVQVDGLVQTDRDGRVIWKRDQRGREVEDLDQLTGQDIEKTLLDITRLKLLLTPQANDLLLEAIFAKHVFDEMYHQAYESVMDGTIKDREAHASRQSRVDKYHAFFRFYLYSHAEVFLKEVNNFARVLERIRFWRTDAQDGPQTTRVRSGS